MAQYGGGSIRTAPRVHRPRAAIMNVALNTLPPPLLTAPLAPLRPSSISPPSPSSPSSAAPPVTLTAPRPETDRVTNEYVDTPFRNHHHLQEHANIAPPPQPPASRTTASRPTRLPLAVTKQPAASFSKEGAECGATATSTRPSIVCGECGRCRCDSCQQPRPLPQRWVCNDGCLLSADSVVDYVSCLCCAKGLFYHCSESDGESCADEPCGCSPQRRKARWGCLGALSCLLPCLWLYWPLRGCKNVVEVCYARHSRTGCRCKAATASTVPTPEKRLLDTSSPQDF